MRWCGNVEVPYPFGFGQSKCYMTGFRLSCDTTHDPPQLLLGSGQFRVVNISLVNTTVLVIRMADLMTDTYVMADVVPRLLDPFPSFFNSEAPYSLSTSNELIITGCNVQATLSGHGNPKIISGCASFCSNNDTTTSTRFMGLGWATNGIHGESGGGSKYCYGVGCCQARISESMDGMPKELLIQWFDTSRPHENMLLPGYAFMAEEGWFDQPGVASKLMTEGQKRKATEHLEVPLLFRWEVATPNPSKVSKRILHEIFLPRLKQQSGIL
ncbi:hypothetical protein ACQ4PT_068996 [Festuca glaucescens]